jgi:hypothetical protein
MRTPSQTFAAYVLRCVRRVQYEGVSCNAQKHLRLTCGWRDYIRRINAEVGEC